jgi:hypothetical protein
MSGLYLSLAKASEIHKNISQIGIYLEFKTLRITTLPKIIVHFDITEQAIEQQSETPHFSGRGYFNLHTA